MIDLGVNCGHNVRGVDRLNHVGEDETAGRVEAAGDASEEISLACAVEVVNRKSRYDEVERPFRQGVLESPYEQLDSIGRQAATGHLDHSGTGVDADELRVGVTVENSPGRLTRPGPELENRLGTDTRCGQGLVLQAVVAGYGLAHHRQVALRREVIVAHRSRSLDGRISRSGESLRSDYRVVFIPDWLLERQYA